MESDYGNDYRRARAAAGMTQERWAEKIGVSVEAVRLYETDRCLPSDEVVQQMIEASMMPVLGYRHMVNKSRLAAQLLPQVPEVGLAQAVVLLLRALRSFQTQHRVDELLQIAADGVVSGAEAAIYEEILEDLQEIVEAAAALRCAQGIKNAPDGIAGTARGHGQRP